MWYFRLIKKEDDDYNCLFAHKKYCEGRVLVSRQVFVDNIIRRQYTIFDGPDLFYDYYGIGRDEDKNYYELIESDAKQKLYFDVDMNSKDFPDVNHLEFIEILITNILEKMPILRRDDLMIFQSHGSVGEYMKYSYHIIVQGHYVNGSRENREVFMGIYKDLPDIIKRGLDDSLHKVHQQFRIWKSRKAGSDRIKELSPLNTNEEFLDSNGLPKNISRELFSKSLITNTDGCKLINVDMTDASLRINRMFNSKSSVMRSGISNTTYVSVGGSNGKINGPMVNGKLIFSESLSKACVNAVLKTFGDIYTIRTPIMMPDMYLLRKRVGVEMWCSKCERTHSSNNATVRYENGHLYFMCFGSEGRYMFHKFDEIPAQLEIGIGVTKGRGAGKIACKNIIDNTERCASITDLNNGMDRINMSTLRKMR